MPMATDETSIIADRDEQDGALRESVGGDPAEGCRQQHGDAEGQVHAAEAGVAPGEVTSEPTAGDGLRHHPEDHQCRTDEQSPETRRLQN